MRIRARPRIHMTLVDMGTATLRSYGGVGFTIEAFSTDVTGWKSDDVVVLDNANMSEDLHSSLEYLLEKLTQNVSGESVAIRINSIAPQHQGFGSKTTLLLAAASLVNCVLNMGLSRRQLQKLSGRGGASGVGVNTFFDGGIVFDGGHPPFPGQTFSPSRARTVANIPPVCVRHPFPEDWKIHILLPNGHVSHGAAETEFFRRAAPIPDGEALQVLAAVYHGILPAVVTGDLQLFSEALDVINETGFKRREIDRQSDDLQIILDKVRRLPDVACGMSSMGPAIFVVKKGDNQQAKARIEEIVHGRTKFPVVETNGWNHGFEAWK